MDSLPNEILQNIFLLLSQKNRIQVALVNKKWYFITRQPCFFDTIHIYNSQQLNKLITATVINNQLIGPLVKRLLLTDYCKIYQFIDQTTVKTLYSIFPNLTFIDILNIDSRHGNGSFIQHMWPQLTTLPKYITNNDPNWYQRINKTKEPITSLAFIIKNNMIQSSNGNNIHENDYSEKLLELKTDNYTSRRKTEDYRVAKHYLGAQYNNHMEIINNEEYIIYFGKILSFSPTSISALVHLKDLTIDFSKRLNGFTTGLELDERTLDSIHQSCPVLASLKIYYLYMNISDQYFKNYQPTYNNITPSYSLKEFYLLCVRILHPACFHYFSNKYPHLTKLHIDPHWSIKHSDSSFQSQFVISFHDMIEGYTHLSSLTFLPFYGYTFDGSNNLFTSPLDYWSKKRFIYWLHDNPTQLEALHIGDILYMFDDEGLHDHDDDYYLYFNPNNGYNYNRMRPTTVTTTMEQNSDKKQQQQQRKNRFIYLDYLKELTLSLYESTIPLTYNHLNSIYMKRQLPFTSITSLTIDNQTELVLYSKHSYMKNKKANAFYFMNWIKMLPHLKKLNLYYVTTIGLDENDDENVFEEDAIQRKINTIFKQNLHKKDDHATTSSSISTTTKTIETQQQQQCISKLEELVIKHSNLKYWNSLTNICRSCPLLRILKLDDVVVDNQDLSLEDFVNKMDMDNNDDKNNHNSNGTNTNTGKSIAVDFNYGEQNDNDDLDMYISEEDEEKNKADNYNATIGKLFSNLIPNDFLIDIPNLTLDELFIKNFFIHFGQKDHIFDLVDSFPRGEGFKVYASSLLTINESYRNNTFTIFPQFSTGNYYHSSINIKINCKYVDHVQFIQNDFQR
ncbi:hypothetical protein BJ944DRAFT_263486 [Cunninghamella echinulata]|nr:hypothetical protein BJ944DRAFT_263486 [Cunninghamella echinulata]